MCKTFFTSNKTFGTIFRYNLSMLCLKWVTNIKIESIKCTLNTEKYDPCYCLITTHALKCKQHLTFVVEVQLIFNYFGLQLMIILIMD